MTSEAQLMSAIGVLTGVVGWFGVRMWDDLKEAKAEIKAVRAEQGMLREKYGVIKGVMMSVRACPVAGCPHRDTTPAHGEKIGSDPANPSIFKTPRIPQPRFRSQPEPS